MRRIILFVILCIVCINTYAQTYNSLWKDVDKAISDDLPQQVISNAEIILKKAKKEKNFAQEMKAWVMIVNATREMSPDSMKVITPPKYNTTPTNDAVVNALMGTSVSRNRYMSNNKDFSKEDSISNYYYNKVLENKEALYQTKVDDYLPLLDKGKDSQLYGDDMLSVMTLFLIEHMNTKSAEKKKLCHDVAEFYKGKGNMNAYTLLTIKEICYYSFDTPYSVRERLMTNLFEETKNLEVGEDVAEWYYEYYRFTQKDTDTDRLAFVREMKTLYPKSHFFNIEEESLTHPTCAITLLNPEDIPCPNQPFALKISSRNLDKATLEVRLFNGLDGNRNILTNGKLIQKKELHFEKKEAEFTELIDSLSLPAERYVLILKGANDEEAVSLDIESLQLVISEIANNKYLAKVFDRITGKPVKGAKFHAFSIASKETIDFISDQNGEALFDFSKNTKSESWQIRAEASERNMTEYQYFYISSREITQKDNTARFHLAFDRPVYRPGQTVKTALVAYLTDTKNLKGNNANIVANESFKIVITDPDGQKLDSKTLITNSLGSASYDFTIPKDAKVGRYTLRIEDKNSTSFMVEEYKRPTYFVECLNDKNNDKSTTNKSYAFNDTLPVIIQAKAFSGVPVQGAKVKYTIVTGFSDFWRPTFLTNEETLAEGETITDKEGKVTIPMFLDDSILENMEEEEYDFISNYRLVRFYVNYTVTDIAGESHSGDYRVSITKNAFDIQISTTNKDIFDGFYNNNIDLSNDTLTIKALNSDGKSVNSSEILNPHYYILTQDSVVVTSGEWKTNAKFTIPEVNDGSYIFRITANDKNGNLIKHDYPVLLFYSKKAIIAGKTTNATKSCFNSPLFVVRNKEFSEDKPATILFSPAYDNTFLYCIITTDDGYVEKKQFNLDKYVHRIDLPYKKEYKEGVCANFFSVRNGKILHNSIVLTYVLPEKNLNLSWKTFRDRLTPGQKEEWILSIQDKSGKGIAGAEMMATLYDASLDEIAYPMLWNFNTNLQRSVTYRSVRMTTSNLSWLSLRISQPSKYVNYDNDVRKFTTMTTFFNNRVLDIRSNGMRLRGAAVRPEMSFGMQKASGLSLTSLDEDLTGRVAGLDVYGTSGSLAESVILSKKPEVKIRSNFAENAFFYPNLISNKDGEVNISFTLPESLTEWKFLGYVHTKDMDYGNIEAKIVARQEFIVQPNIPRFIREGDNLNISSRIINQSDKDIKGTALLRLLNADTEEVILTQEVPFSVFKEQTESVSFNLSPTSYIIRSTTPSSLICEITAQSESFSDGEKNYIPILPSRQSITETFPFYLENETSKIIDLHTLFNNSSSSATDKKLSLTFTGNPSTLVFDALKAMQLPEYDNAPCFAASLYANSMLKYLGEENDSLDILLHQAEEKLFSLQNPDGSWSWFEGMTGSYNITLAVCENLALLSSVPSASVSSSPKEFINLSAEMRSRFNKALDYLDKEELANFVYLQKQKHPSFVPSESTLHYLYLYTLLTDRQMSNDVKKMSDTYLKEFQKMSKQLSIYGKANGSNLLRHNGFTKPAEKFLQSVLEYSVYKPGMGRYFDTNKALYSWRDYKIPTQLAAMKAIVTQQQSKKNVIAPKSYLNEMLIWLLRQKQTQTWDNPMNTVDVADFILRLSDGTRPTGTSNESFSLDGKNISANDTIAVESVNQLAVKLAPDTSTPAHISWGAVTASFSELTENIKSNSTEGLSISYEIISSATSKKTSTFEVGNKATIRLTIDADRDMDFVQIDCQHPACFEPTDQHSGYCRIGGQGGYLSRHDSHSEIFFDTFRKGTHVIELEFFVSHEGTYQCGISTAKCTYCPDFSAHSNSQTITVTH